MHKTNPRPDLSAAVNSGRPQIATQQIEPGAKCESAIGEQSYFFDLARSAKAGIKPGMHRAGLMVQVGRFAGKEESFGFGLGEDFGSVRGGDRKETVGAAREGIGRPVVVMRRVTNMATDVSQRAGLNVESAPNCEGTLSEQPTACARRWLA